VAFPAFIKDARAALLGLMLPLDGALVLAIVLPE
jgi:hypothetical protein